MGPESLEVTVAVWRGPLRSGNSLQLSLLLIGIFLAGLPAGISAQDPPPAPADDLPPVILAPDAIELNPAPVDTLRAVPPADATGDTLAQDTLQADSVPPRVVRNLPDFITPVPAGWETGVWEWEEEDLLSARALTLIDLLMEVPGLLPLQSGDYGHPAAVTAFGVEGGRVRLYRDGVEMAPLDGGVVDLSRVGIAGIGRVRVERRLGELQVELYSIRLHDPRAYSRLEVATGDLNTNAFRGTFAHPFALGGQLMAVLDRIDTDGTERSEPGVSFGANVRHTIFLGDRGGIVWDFSRMSSKRPPSLWTHATVRRTDFGIQGRFDLLPGVIGSAYYRSSSLEPVGEAEDAPVPEVGKEPRKLVGLRLSAERGPLWGEAEAKFQRGERWPSSAFLLEGGGALPEFGGVSAGVEQERWEGGESALNLHLRAWTAPRFGFSLFGEFQDGERGVPGHVPPAPEEDEGEEGEEEPEEELPEPLWVPSFTNRSGLRAGLGYRSGGWGFGAALLRIEADSLPPMEFLADRGGATGPGGVRSGIELSAHLPLTRLMRGLYFEGSGELWEEGDWRYLPEKAYRAQLRYHGLFYDTGNLEVWWNLGVRGRSAMLVPADAGAVVPAVEVPFRQSWFARVQVRVISVRLFLDWENFTVRDENQDFPGRLLPHMRVVYGIRWTLWN